MLYLYQTWSIRVYNIILRNMPKSTQVLDAQDAETLGDLIVAGKVQNAGWTAACELYRGAGLGVYNIYKKLGGRIEINKIRWKCEYCDRVIFHARLD